MERTAVTAFSGNLRDLLAARGLHPHELAEKVPCARSTLYRWLTGTAEPGITAATRLAEELGCTVDFLISRHVDDESYQAGYRDALSDVRNKLAELGK